MHVAVVVVHLLLPLWKLLNFIIFISTLLPLVAGHTLEISVFKDIFLQTLAFLLLLLLVLVLELFLVLINS